MPVNILPVQKADFKTLTPPKFSPRKNIVRMITFRALVRVRYCLFVVAFTDMVFCSPLR
jgi:hypothetical protein